MSYFGVPARVISKGHVEKRGTGRGQGVGGGQGKVDYEGYGERQCIICRSRETVRKGARRRGTHSEASRLLSAQDGMMWNRVTSAAGRGCRCVWS